MTNTRIEVVRLNGRVFRESTLVKVLGNRPKLVVKFGKLLELDGYQLSSLLRLTCPGVGIVQALSESGLHSGNLQSYVIELGYEYLITAEGQAQVAPEDAYADDTEGLLDELVEQASIRVAETIEDLADQIESAMAIMPGKKARMEVKALSKINKKTGRIGVDQTLLTHGHKPKSLVIFDTSGSMGQNLVSRLADEVLKMAIEADATLAIVSNTSAWWDPGTFDVKAVLDRAEYGGTQYETLSALLDQDWSVVVTVADFDSSWSAKEAIAKCKGKVGRVLDISVVDRPTFLGECVAQLAGEYEVLCVGSPALQYSY